MRVWAETAVKQLIAEHGGRDPAEIIRENAMLLLQEANLSNDCVDVGVLASLRGVSRIRVRNQEEAGRTYYHGDDLVIDLKATDSRRRRRFTCLHEVTHTFFPGFFEEKRARRDRAVGRYRINKEEEYLCDLGARELLLPASRFARHLESLDTGIKGLFRLVDIFDASLEATGIRMAQLSKLPVAVLILEPAMTRAQKKWLEIEPFQPPLFPLPPKVEPPWRLRVKYAATSDTFGAYIPRRKSAPLGSIIARALEEGEVEAIGPLGLVRSQRPYRVEARLLAYRSSHEVVDRVIAVAMPIHHPSNVSQSQLPEFYS